MSEAGTLREAGREAGSSASAEADTLPHELVPRGAALLVRGGVAATAALVLLGAGAAVTYLGSVAVDQLDCAPLRFAFGLVATLLVIWGVALLFAAPLVVFAHAWRGTPGLRSVLRASAALTPRIIDKVCGGLVTSAVGIGLALFWFWLAEDARTKPIVGLMCLVIGVAMLAFTAWFHGLLVLVGSARVALGRRGAFAGGLPSELIATGAPPFFAAGVFVGGWLIQQSGAAKWGSLPPAAFVIGGVVAVAVAHVVSCALGVAIASREEGVEERVE